MSRRGSKSVFDAEYSRRRFLQLSAGATAGAALSFARPGSAGRVSAQTAEISMMGWGSPLEKENVEKGMQAFEAANPDIKVDWIHTPNDQYETKLNTAMAGGNPPDLFWGSNMADYVARGVAMDISSLLQADPVVGAPGYFLEPQEANRSAINNKWYGIGSCWVVHHLYYNKKLLDAAGVEPPPVDASQAWTWDQFLDISKQLTVDGSGKHPDQEGFDADDIQQWGISWAAWSLPRDVLVYSNEGEAYTSDYTCHLGEPAAVEAYQALADLTLVHHVAPQAAAFEQLGFGQAWEALASDKVALLCDGSWALQDISKLGIEFGCGVLPKMKVAVTEAQAHAHMIHKGTENPEASWKLLAYLSSDDYQRSLLQAGLWLPSHTSLLSEDGLATWITEGVHPEGYDRIATDYLANYAKSYFYPAGFSETDKLIEAAMQAVWIGEQTAEQAIVESGVIDQVNAILQEKKAAIEENTA
jgi:multiple sugar transport system substrate-binding protein